MNVRDYVRAYPTTDPPDVLIHCARCGTDKEPREFYVTRARRCLSEGSLRGVTGRCRSCGRANMDRHLAERREIIESAKAGGCVDCGLVNLDHPEIFDFDHVRPGKVKTINTPVYPVSKDQVQARIIDTGFHSKTAIYGK